MRDALCRFLITANGEAMKRWGFDVLHFQNRKQLISAGGLKRRTTPHCFI